MGTARGFDRLVFFTDAVTAIAITLLILPLVDLVPEYARQDGATVAGFIHDYWTPIWAFLLSFLIIARLWMANHSVLEHVERQSATLMVLEIGWVFTIVVLPLPTALIATLPPDRFSVALYIGTMTVGSLIL
ncbi:MAG: TMEM175 family protein, partial [Leifsonia sp.]